MARKQEPEKSDKVLDQDKTLDDETNILSLIETDHHEVEQLFEEIEGTKGKKAQSLFAKIYTELSLHAHAEELVFYPAMREYKETEKFIEEAEQEHNSVKILLEQMKDLKPSDAEFETKMEHLKESVMHHVEEEEEEIFAAVSKVMSEEQLQKLAQEFQTAKERWKADVEAALKK